MPHEGDNTNENDKKEQKGTHLCDGVSPFGMTKRDRQRVVLEFMEKHQLALPQKVIFRNLKLHKNITFSFSSVDNYLREFEDKGLVRRVKPSDLSDGQLTDWDESDDPEDMKSYYIITSKGKQQFLNDEF